MGNIFFSFAVLFQMADGLEFYFMSQLICPFQLEAKFDPVIHNYRERADKIMLGMCAFLLLCCMLNAALTSSWAALLAIGVPTTALGAYLTYALPGHLLTRLFMGCGDDV